MDNQRVTFKLRYTNSVSNESKTISVVLPSGDIQVWFIISMINNESDSNFDANVTRITFREEEVGQSQVFSDFGNAESEEFVCYFDNTIELSNLRDTYDFVAALNLEESPNDSDTLRQLYAHLEAGNHEVIFQDTPTNNQGQLRGNNFVNLPNPETYESNLQALQEIGFSLEQSMRALQLTYNDLNQAASFLTEGINDYYEDEDPYAENPPMDILSIDELFRITREASTLQARQRLAQGFTQMSHRNINGSFQCLLSILRDERLDLADNISENPAPFFSMIGANAYRNNQNNLEVQIPKIYTAINQVPEEYRRAIRDLISDNPHVDPSIVISTYMRLKNTKNTQIMLDNLP